MTDGSARKDGIVTLGLLVAAAALHLGLLAYYLPRGLFASGQPILEFDYSLHAYQVTRALAAFQQTGRLWGYDPSSLAGQPVNAVEDLTSKSLELFVLAATRLGARPWGAFNAYILGAHLALPLGAWASARCLGFTRPRAAATTLAWVVLWFFDSFLHWCWHIGMISWSLASVLSILVVALCHRAFTTRRPTTYAALVLCAATLCLVHPFAVLTVALPLGALYVRAFGRLSSREHAALAAGVALSASTVLVWVGPALLLRDGVTRIDEFLWPTARYVVLDSFDLLKDMLMTGQPLRTGFRLVAFVLAGHAVLRWARDGDSRALPLGVLIASGVVFAYGMGYVPALRQTQPYRHIAPATLAAGLAAASLLPEGRLWPWPSTQGREARLALALAAVVGIPHLSRTVLHYLPSLVPAQSALVGFTRRGPAVDGTNQEPPPLRMGHELAPPEYEEIGRVATGAFSKGRVAVVHDWVLAEYLTTFTELPVVGGIPQRNVPQVAAHPLRHDLAPSKGQDDDPFSRYLTQYAVEAVITSGDMGWMDARDDLLDLVASVKTHRIYRVKHAPSYFQQGEGRVVAQKLNSITIADFVGPEAVLRFHWIKTLRCRPDCAVERAAADRDLAGFLRVRNPPSHFEIYNAVR